MWRFKASKYKNAAPKIPKKEDRVNDVHVGNIMPSSGNHIKASNIHMAFSVESVGGGKIAVLPVDQKGRPSHHNYYVQAHGDHVTDFDFSPFNDCILASGSQDCMIKLWELPDKPLTENLSNPLHVLARESKRIENILWHKHAENLLAASTHHMVKIYDVTAQRELSAIEAHSELVQSLSWKGDGSSIVTTGKDAKIKILDPRNGQVSLEATGHPNIKDSRALWLGNTDSVLTTGFNTMREREVKIRDVRNLSSSLKTVIIGSSTGAMIPLYDSDTGMLFLAGLGDTNIKYCECLEKEPYLTENASDIVEQIKGMALVPKLSMDVMKCEVNRVLVLAQNSVIQIPYCVPRKNYHEFHEDLFPNSAGMDPACTAEEWFKGSSAQVNRISLNPDKSKKSSRPVNTKPDAQKLLERSTSQDAPSPKQMSNNVVNNISKSPSVSPPKSPPPVTSKPVIHKETPNNSTPVMKVELRSVSSQKKDPSVERPHSWARKPVKALQGIHQAKFRHMKVTVAHRSMHIENIRNLAKNVPGESNLFHANKERCAVPLGGSGGLIGIYEMSNPGRLPETGNAAIQNGSTVMDFEWDPFDDNTLVVGCDDAKLKLWHIPNGGLTEVLTKPELELIGHTEKIYFVRYHPLAKSVIASASYDMTVRIWNIATSCEVFRLEGHSATIFDLAWSPNGKYCATSCRDGKIRVFNPRISQDPISEGQGLEGARGGRIIWTLNGSHIVVTGFDKTSSRCIAIYDVADLDNCLQCITLDVSPAILVPFYDEDSSTLFLTGRGDSTVFTYEVLATEPYLFPLTPYKASSPHQALSFLPKSQCDVIKVEFAKAYRLTQTTVEPLAFSIPRVKMEFFQDDLFPDTSVTWKPTMTAFEWFNEQNKVPIKINLRPEGMKLLSEAPVEAPKPRKYESYNPETYKTEEQKKEELMSAVTNKLALKDEPLPQDLTEGVDDDEWDD